jgi:CSLREA domain-containing protein
MSLIKFHSNFIAVMLVMLLIHGTISLAQIPRTAFTVDITADTPDANPGDGICADANEECSLRAAVMEANALPGDDTISIDAGTYILDNPTPGDEELSIEDDLDILDNLTINGEGFTGATATVIKNPVFVVGTEMNVFELQPDNFTGVTLNLNNIRIEGGTDGFDTEYIITGIRVSSKSTLNVSSVVLADLYYSTVNSGLMTISGSFITNNFYGIETDSGDKAVSVNNTQFFDNDQYGLNSQSGNLTIIDSQFLDNGGTGIDIHGGQVTIQGSKISGNKNGGLQNGYPGVGGTIQVINTEISGNISGVLGGGGVNNWDGTITIQNGLILNNESPSDGGGISNQGTIIIEDSTLSGNKANSGSGGGIFNSSIGDLLDITSSTVTDNEALDGGGFYENSSFNPVHLRNVTFSSNRAVNGSGGAIYINDGVLTVNNATISLNSAENNAEAFGGGVYVSGADADLTLVNTITAGNLANDNPSDCFLNLGTMNSGGNNLFGTSAGCTGYVASDLLDTDPLLEPLADNGGGTFTHALQTNSPAINAGNPATCEPTDQRGLYRDGPCDIGAFEFNGTTNTPTPGPTGTAVDTTATPTSTPSSSTEMVENGGFETLDSSNKPDITPWTIKNASGDKAKCNKDKDGDGTVDKIVANTGNCAFQFKGLADENAKLSQNVDLTGLSFDQGDSFNLSAFVKASGGVNARIKVRIKFSDGTETGKINVTISAAADYAEVTGSVNVASSVVQKIKLQIDNKGTSGKVFIDDVTLKHIPADSLLPLP